MIIKNVIGDLVEVSKMNKKNREQKEFEEWHKMKSKGKKKIYLA